MLLMDLSVMNEFTADDWQFHNLLIVVLVKGCLAVLSIMLPCVLERFARA